MSSFKELQELMQVLYKECPWDRKQTFETLRPYILEEVYETIEAVNSGNNDKIKEELGDVSLLLAFYLEVARANNIFRDSEVFDHIIEKMKRRHPHIFGDTKVNDAADVKRNWEEIKKLEKKEKRDSLLDGVPSTLPALVKATRIQGRAASVGFDWDDIKHVFAKVREEIGEFENALENNSVKKMEEELGDVFFAMVNVARFLKIDPEFALQKTVNKFINRFKYIEKKLDEKNKTFSESSLEEMDGFWEEAKGLEE